MRYLLISTFLLMAPLLASSQKNALDYVQDGQKNLDDKKYEDALKDFDKAMELNPEYQWACHKLKAETHSRMADYVGAVYEYSRALEINAKDPESYLKRGIAKFDNDDEKGAIEDFNKALELKPGYAEAYFERGYAKGALGSKRGSCEDWQKAAELGDKEALKMISTFCSQ